MMNTSKKHKERKMKKSNSSLSVSGKFGLLAKCMEGVAGENESRVYVKLGDEIITPKQSFKFINTSGFNQH